MGDRTMLSEFFSADEFACRCCLQVRVHQRLLNALDDLRILAAKPIHITRMGGCRCRRANEVAGGTRASLHLIEDADENQIQCKAADIYVIGLPLARLFRLAGSVPALELGGLGYYPQEGFIHVDVRHGKARWARMVRGGQYTQLPSELQGV